MTKIQSQKSSIHCYIPQMPNCVQPGARNSVQVSPPDWQGSQLPTAAFYPFIKQVGTGARTPTEAFDMWCWPPTPKLPRIYSFVMENI